MTFVLDAYAARSCPLKTAHAFTPALVAPTRERPNPAFFHDADAIEADVLGRLAGSGVSLVDLRPLRDRESAAQEEAALAALSSDVDVIVGALLPRDYASHRSGRPSLLVRSPDGSGYRPVQIKFHRVVETRPCEEPPLHFSTLDAPCTPQEFPGRRFRWRQRLNAALQVAHYWRLLESAGFAADHPVAGLIGIDRLERPPASVPRGDGSAHEQVITWLDLTEPAAWPSARVSPAPGSDLVATLSRYDDEHRFRVQLAEAALAASGEVSPLTPIMSSECGHCVWQGHCQTQLDADDLSVRISKAPLDVHEVRTLRRLGITTVTDFARADLESLLADYLPHVAHRPGAEARLLRAHHRARLMHAGIELERQTEGPIALAPHSLEIDLDIETSADDRVYLWGFWVSDAAAGAPYYRHFSAFADLDDAAELALACRAMAWLREVTRGRDAAVYHYSDYEVVRLNRLAGRCGDPEMVEWARDFSARSFVDLFSVVRQHYFGANGLGLKVVATAVTGFAWRDEEPGGLNSQGWFSEAVHDEDPAVRELARVRVLQYNEDDVRATWHLRRWLREQR